MGIFWICAAASMFCVGTYAAPHTEKRLWDPLSATRQRRTDGSGVSSCQKASEAMGQLLLLSQDTNFSRYLRYLELFLNFDAFDPEERETFVCQFSDLETLQGFINAADHNGILSHVIRRVYNYLAAMSMYEKVQLLTLLAESDEYSWISPEEIQVELDLITTLESTGLLALDPEGADLTIEIINEEIGGNPIQNYTSEPLSDEPLQARVNKLTNAIRKVWNQHVQQVSEWNPDYSRELRQNIEEWTGITIGNHVQMKSIVQDLLEVAFDGLPGIIRFVENSKMVYYALEKGYPLLVDSVNYLQSDHFNPNPVYYYYYDNGPYISDVYKEYQAVMTEINETLLSLLENLREMGLFSLEDDLLYSTNRS